MTHVPQEAQMLKGEHRTAWTPQESTRQKDAIFLGWQKTSVGEPFALYTITAADHPSLGSTVTDKSLLKLNLQIPRTPPPPEKRS
jgi:hypothetical protein